MFLVLVLFACPVARSPVVAPPTAVPAPDAGGSSIAAALARVDALLATVDEIDRRDRLVELRDLVAAAQTSEPAARRTITDYANRVLAIEERASPVGLEESPVDSAAATLIVTEEPVGVAPGPAVPAPEPVPPPPAPDAP